MEEILIVDDSPLNLKVLTDLLSSDYKVFTASSGEAVFDVLNDCEPKLILLDVILPGISGFEVIKHLKQNEKTKEIPVIFITGLNTEQSEETGLSLGAVDYITKPFKAAIVKARVKTHIQLYSYRQTIERLVTIDGLTGVHNRRGLDEFLEVQWKNAKRHKQPISLIVCDIDFFKLYNDNYGHLNGDNVLKQVAQAIKSAPSRPTDYVARYGGEEFFIILPNANELGGMKIAQRIADFIAKSKIKHQYSKVSDMVTVSMGGVTTIPKKEDRLEDFIKKADEMLYVSKNSGRNKITWFNEMCRKNIKSKKI